MTKQKFRQVGLSLVELMVGLTIGLIATAALAVVYSSSQQTTRTVNAISRTQQDVRYVTALLGEDITRAGSYGCAGFTTITSTGSGLTFVPYGISYNATGSSFAVAYMVTPTTLTTDLASGATTDLAVQTSSLLAAGAPAMIVDCTSRILYTTGSTNVSHSAFSAPFKAGDTLVGNYIYHEYSICGNDLCRGTDVIAENVSRFSMTFGYATGTKSFASYESSASPSATSDRPVYVQLDIWFKFDKDLVTGKPLTTPYEQQYTTTFALISNTLRSKVVTTYTEPDPTVDPVKPGTACP